MGVVNRDYMLIVKGVSREALDACAAHGISAMTANKDEGLATLLAETRLIARDADSNALAAWFNEDGTNPPPYPTGALLFYTELLPGAKRFDIVREKENE